MSALLELDAVDTYYGPIHILQGLSLQVQAGELVCLLGGNASGKSTTLKTILGIVTPRSGNVRFARDRHFPGRGESLCGWIVYLNAIQEETFFLPPSSDQHSKVGQHSRRMAASCCPHLPGSDQPTHGGKGPRRSPIL